MDVQNQQNFMRQVPIEDAVSSRPPGFYKSIFLNVCTVASALALSCTYKFFIDGRSGLALTFVTLCIFLVLSTIEVFVIASLPRRALILVLEIIALLSFFYDRTDGVILLTGGLMLFFSVIGEIRSRLEISNSLELRYFNVAKIKIAKLITAISIMAVALYLPQLSVENLSVNNIFINPKGFSAFFDWSATFVKRLYPEIEISNVTVDKLIRDIAIFKLQAVPGFKNFAPIEQQQSISNAVLDLTNQLVGSFQIQINPNETTNQLFYKIIVTTLEKWKQNFGVWFLVGWLVVFFLIIRGIGVLFSFVFAGITFTFIQLLLGLNFVHIAGESRMKETIKF